ncbi:hypothetical protein F5Y16DRAFT_374162 [Xylariaceae sp. FL0255]|nr:hypothetical protein F5Y16DRAFT_374162 [Xylariaceae sp. FL0255]
MAAQSGWSTGEKKDDRCLDTELYNKIALHHIAGLLEFPFPGNQRDGGNRRALAEERGRAHAGHVEVLLASWFAIYAVRQSVKLVEETDVELVPHLKNLKQQNLGPLRTAFITIDSEPCRTCLQFLNKLSQLTGIVFMVFGSAGVGPVIVRSGGSRRLDVIAGRFIDDGDEAEVDGNADDDNDSDSLDGAANSQPSKVNQTPQQWRAQSADLVETYRKKTPVYSWPGYEDARPPKEVVDLTLDSDNEDGGDDGDYEMVETVKSPKMDTTTSMFFEVAEDDDQEWEIVDREDTDGQLYATAALEVVRDRAQEPVPKSPVPESPVPKPARLPLLGSLRRTASDTSRRNNARLASRRQKSSSRPRPRPQLQQFALVPVDEANRSIYKSRYAILRPSSQK